MQDVAQQINDDANALLVESDGAAGVGGENEEGGVKLNRSLEQSIARLVLVLPLSMLSPEVEKLISSLSFP